MRDERLLQMSGVVVDLVYRVDSVPAPGANATVQSCMITAGGGFNAMVSAKRAGMEVAYGGAHGSGVFADIVRRELARVDIPLLQQQSEYGDQGSCVVLVDRQGERTFISKDGADGILDDGLLGRIDPSEYGWILLSGFALTHAGSQEAMCRWLQDLPDGASLVFDPSPAVKTLPGPVLALALSKAKWISANAYEAAAITGAESVDVAAGLLITQLSRSEGGVVVRCGADGCWVARRAGGPTHVAGFAIDTVDTNGAGDTHVGGFVAALSKGADALEAARYANAAAALSTTYFGPATAPTDVEIREFLGRRTGSQQNSLAGRAVAQ